MVVVNRIAPSEIIVVIRRVIDGPVIKVEVSVTMPRTPTVGWCVALNDSNFWLSAICGDFKIFYINLLAAFGDNMKLHPSIFDMAGCRNLNVFGSVFRAKDKSVAVTCLFSVFVVITAACCLALGVTNPCATCDRFVVVFNF